MFRTVLLAAVVPLALGSEYSYTYDYTDAPTAAPTAETTYYHRLCAVASVSSATGGRQSLQIRSEYVSGHATTARCAPRSKRRMRYERY